MEALAAYEDIESWCEEDENEKNKKASKSVKAGFIKHQSPEEPLEAEYSVDDKKKNSSRDRPTLGNKYSIVQEYYDFLKHSDIVTGSTNEFSIRSYVEMYNSNPSNKRLLHVSNLSKWVRAERRGEYLPWNGINKLDSRTCKIVNLVRHLDYILKLKYPCHGIYNQVSKSLFVANEYGVTAREFAPQGTFLGYYMGEVINGQEANKRTESQEYMFTLGKNRFIDAKAYDSCFARYYNCAMKASDQNVSVERLDSKDPQSVICFITNRDVPKGEEFLISYGSAYWERAAQRAPVNSPFRRVCNAMLDQSPTKFETLESLYSVEAPILAANFGDKSTTVVIDDDENDSDSDYMEE
jgi:hypothetical protein